MVNVINTLKNYCYYFALRVMDKLVNLTLCEPKRLQQLTSCCKHNSTKIDQRFGLGSQKASKLPIFN